MKTVSMTQRLLALVQVVEGDCWKPRRYIEPHGYARLMIGGELRYLHILSYETFVGPVPKGKELDHICRHTWYFNWEHVEPVTSRVNSLRGEHPLFKACREGRCLKGHDVSGGNVYRRCDGRPRCRQCELDRRRKAA